MKKVLIYVVLIVLIIGGGYYFLNKNSSYATPAQTDQTDNQNNIAVGEPNPSAPKSYTLADVSIHKDAKSCWTTVNGNVYDVTVWINKHPGGPQAILSICGKDGSSAFNTQHGGQQRPADELKNFLIGVLSK